MKEITFSGASDDLIHIDGFGDEFEEVYANRNKFHVGAFIIVGDGEGVTVHVIYDGTWAFAVTSENDDPPDWPITREWGTICPYSETIRITVPDNATIRRRV